MNAYLFTAGTTQTRIVPTSSRGQIVNMPQTYDGTMSVVVYGGNPEQAQRQFEAWCCQPGEKEQLAITKIKKIVVAQLVDELMAEAGGTPPDWPQIAKQVDDLLQATPLDDFEQGYWVDANEAVPPGIISPDVESLRRSLPEDIRSGLNWSPGKQFFFLMRVFSPRPVPVFAAEDVELRPDVSVPDDEHPEPEEPDLEAEVAARDELRDLETAALVVARNSTVAAWLWRKHCAATRLAANDIKIDPCCGFIPVA